MGKPSAYMTAKKDPESMKGTKLYKNFAARYGTSKNTQLFFSDVEELLKEAGITDQYISSRIFKCMDDDKSGSVSYTEMAQFCAMLGRGSMDEKMRFIFDACDLNSNGQIEAYELRKFLKHLMINCASKLPHYVILTSEQDIAMFADLETDKIAGAVSNRMVYDIFKIADADKGCSIDFKEFSFWYKRGDKSVKSFVDVFKLFDLLVVE